MGDLITLEDKPPEPNRPVTFYHPSGDYRKFRLDNYTRFEPLLQRYMEEGRRVIPETPLPDIRERTIANLKCLDETYTRLINPHIYKVSVSRELKALKQDFLARYLLEPEE
jgi:nicotinate phosphoribosyltransferase